MTIYDCSIAVLAYHETNILLLHGGSCILYITYLFTVYGCPKEGRRDSVGEKLCNSSIISSIKLKNNPDKNTVRLAFLKIYYMFLLVQ